jgi:hypothetical protein
MDIAWWAYLTVVAALSAYALHRLHLVLAAWRTRRAAGGQGAPLADLPIVTVQLPIYNERFVAERLIDAVAALDWPRDRLEVQVLDDSTDDTVELCRNRIDNWRAAGLAIEHVRRGDRAGFKAGALQHGLSRARGQLLLVLDADFVPPPDLLRRMAAHLVDDGVAMVQARWEHLNRGASALTSLQALLLDGHFGVEQAARSRTGRFFNFNGTAGLWRRTAIDDAGGWHGDTLTEDLDLSYRVLLRGWRFAYLIDQAVPGELPADINGFKSQQFRWAKGSMQVARKLLPSVLRSRRSVAVKLEAFFHLTHNLPYLLTAALALLAVPALAWRDQPPGPIWIEAALTFGAAVVTAAYLLAAQSAVRGARLGLRAGIGVVARVPAIIALTAGISLSQSRAVLEGLIGRPSEFVRTPKRGLVGAERAAAPGYAAPAGRLPLELCAAAYLAAGLVHALAARRFMAVPILALFAAGFASVGAASLRANRSSGKKSGR